MKINTRNEGKKINIFIFFLVRSRRKKGLLGMNYENNIILQREFLILKLFFSVQMRRKNYGKKDNEKSKWSNFLF